MSGQTLEMICHCGTYYDARIADLIRGWALSCDKSCAAKRRDFGKPKARRADGLKLPKKQRHGARRFTPDYRCFLSKEEETQRMDEQALSDCDMGWDEHKHG